MRSSDITVRTATIDDRDTIYRWRSDPAIAAKGGTHFSYDEHCAWFARKLQSPDTHLFMVDDAGVGIGHIRYDEHPGRVFSLSIYIMPPHQQLGIGSIAMNMTAALLGTPATLYADVRRDNPRSLAFFTANGFAIDATMHDVSLTRLRKTL